MEEERTLLDDLLVNIARLSSKIERGDASKEEEQLYLNLLRQYMAYEKQLNDANLEIEKFEFEKEKYLEAKEKEEAEEMRKSEEESENSIKEAKKFKIEMIMKAAAIGAGLVTAGMYCCTGLTQMKWTMINGGLLGRDGKGFLDSIKNIRF